MNIFLYWIAPPGAQVQSHEAFSDTFTCVLGLRGIAKADCRELPGDWDHPSIYVFGLLKSHSRYQSQAKYMMQIYNEDYAITSLVSVLNCRLSINVSVMNHVGDPGPSMKVIKL
jgi:hypothetical protein